MIFKLSLENVFLLLNDYQIQHKYSMFWDCLNLCIDILMNSLNVWQKRKKQWHLQCFILYYWHIRDSDHWWFPNQFDTEFRFKLWLIKTWKCFSSICWLKLCGCNVSISNHISHVVNCCLTYILVGILLIHAFQLLALNLN